MKKFDGERYALARERIATVREELAAGGAAAPQFEPFLKVCADWLAQLTEERDFIEDGGLETADEAALRARNERLYAEILPAHYDKSYANPAYAARALGTEYGPLCAALLYELRSAIPFLYEGAQERVLIRFELFLEVYGAFTQVWREYRETAEQAADGMTASDDRSARTDDGAAASGSPSEQIASTLTGLVNCGARANGETAEAALPQAGVPAYAHLRRKIYSYLADYAEDEALYEIRQKLVGEVADDEDYGLRLLARADLSDLRYLYAFGEYVGENERGAAAHLNALPPETIAKMADTYTEGYRIGFAVTGKDLSQKKTAGVIYHLGLERMVRRAAENFAAMGLGCTLYREVPTLFRLLRSGKSGYAGADGNPQYLFDHREDLALFLDDELLNRKLEALERAYRVYGAQTRLFAGPAVIETFGEAPFSPAATAARPAFDEVQQRRIASYYTKASLLYNEAVVGRNRSFTIIAFPLPEISQTQYAEIFDAVVAINTLDYHKYSRIQETLIAVLNRARSVRVRGRGQNRTALTVALQSLTDPAHQTLFENCVADVNIPVGEVFTTPRLRGTNGVLHVSEVFLNGLQFRDLSLTFEDGRVVDYGCANFEDAAQGRKYIEDNILFHHDRLPMGECAIGTNTTAYAAAKRYRIGSRLPILIAEKTGPHFAVGDTCYSHEEDNRQYNPDGKEIVAKDNDVSLLRRTNPNKAYFGCHTDVTIPYEEIGSLCAVLEDGTEIPVIENGFFVLPGTEALNEPLHRDSSLASAEDILYNYR